MLRQLFGGLGAAALVLVAGCSADPAAQGPVQLKPGYYSVSLSGVTDTALPFQTAAQRQKSVCVEPSEAEFFPQSFPREFLSSIAPTCSGPNSERVGNRVTGSIRCPLSGGLIAGEWLINFEGSVEEERVDVRAEMQMDKLSPENQKLADDLDMSLRLEIERSGDCPSPTY